MIQNNTIIHKKIIKIRIVLSTNSFILIVIIFLRAIIKFWYRVEKKNIADSVNYY